MINHEKDYLDIMHSILAHGDLRKGRNGYTKSMPFQTLTFNCLSFDRLPLLTSRKMYPKGILGEYAAMIRSPKHVDDFKKWGCNYWNLWAEEDGSLELDYGNSWFNYNGINQLEDIVNRINQDYTDRRLLMNAWRPDRLSKLSLACCHYSYQFWSDGFNLSLLWNQRSADWCVGVPSDMITASLLLKTVANLTHQQPGMVKMVFGDAHIYKEHFRDAKHQTKQIVNITEPPLFSMKIRDDLYSFEPTDISIKDYNPEPPIKYELKG